jgi:acetyl-CoA C-acetyltransferase
MDDRGKREMALETCRLRSVRMSGGNAYIVGAFEHPTRRAEDKSVAQIHGESAKGALADAGLSFDDVDGYFVARDGPGVLGGIGMAEYMGLNKLRYLDNTETGGSAPLVMAGHAARAILSGRCRVALITMGGKSLTGDPKRMMPDQYGAPELPFEAPYGINTHAIYAMAAQRHIHEFGTTREQMSWVKVAASHHAQHNPNAVLPRVVTLEEVSESPRIADPLRRLDCCLNTDGGGAIVVASEEVARSLDRPLIRIRGAAEALKHQDGGRAGFTWTAGRESAARAFAEAGVTPADIKYASVYDSFTMTVIITLEDIGFCEKGKGGAFVSDGNLISGIGKLPVNTDGGGLCNNHPGGRGGIPKLVEAVRQVRGEAHPKVQVPDCDLVLAHGTGGFITTRGGSATMILERAR